MLEGENREKFAAFLREHEKNGLYALYKKNGELYYVGRASNLLGRLQIHRSDLHGKNWDRLAIYILDEKVTLHEVESVLIAVSKPPGNKNRGRLKGDLKKALKEFPQISGAGGNNRQSLSGSTAQRGQEESQDHEAKNRDLHKVQWLGGHGKDFRNLGRQSVAASRRGTSTRMDYCCW
jgi:hypothetical protein